MHKPQLPHLLIAKQTQRYIRSTKDFSIFFNKRVVQHGTKIC